MTPSNRSVAQVKFQICENEYVSNLCLRITIRASVRPKPTSLSTYTKQQHKLQLFTANPMPRVNLKLL